MHGPGSASGAAGCSPPLKKYCLGSVWGYNPAATVSPTRAEPQMLRRSVQSSLPACAAPDAETVPSAACLNNMSGEPIPRASIAARLAALAADRPGRVPPTAYKLPAPTASLPTVNITKRYASTASTINGRQQPDEAPSAAAAAVGAPLLSFGVSAVLGSGAVQPAVALPAQAEAVCLTRLARQETCHQASEANAAQVPVLAQQTPLQLAHHGAGKSAAQLQEAALDTTAPLLHGGNHMHVPASNSMSAATLLQPALAQPPAGSAGANYLTFQRGGTLRHAPPAARPHKYDVETIDLVSSSGEDDDNPCATAPARRRIPPVYSGGSDEAMMQHAFGERIDLMSSSGGGGSHNEEDADARFPCSVARQGVPMAGSGGAAFLKPHSGACPRASGSRLSARAGNSAPGDMSVLAAGRSAPAAPLEQVGSLFAASGAATSQPATSQPGSWPAVGAASAGALQQGEDQLAAVRRERAAAYQKSILTRHPEDTAAGGHGPQVRCCRGADNVLVGVFPGLMVLVCRKARDAGCICFMVSMLYSTRELSLCLYAYV